MVLRQKENSMIEPGYFFMTVEGLTIGTVLIRGLFIFLSGKFSISENLRQLFSYIPAAVFPALVVPASYYHAEKERMIALVLAGALCYFFRNTLAVISFGLIALYVLKSF